MKVTLTFDLPEEKDELMTALHAGQFCSVLIDIESKFRETLKYSTGPDNRKDARAYIEAIRTSLLEELSNTNWRE